MMAVVEMRSVPFLPTCTRVYYRWRTGIIAGGQAMATGDDLDPAIYQVETETSKEARRADLDHSISMMVVVPVHGPGPSGRVAYGNRPFDGGFADTAIVDEFKQDIEQFLSGLGRGLVFEGFATEDQIAAIRLRPYSVGPAAQEWPQFILNFIQDARPVLNDGATLLAWGGFIKAVIDSIGNWVDRRKATIAEERAPQLVEYDPRTEVAVKPVFTRAAIVCLCYQDMVTRSGVGTSCTVDVLTRSAEHYAGPDHPSGMEAYLIRFGIGSRNFIYHVNAYAFVLEHYLISGADMTMLTLPKFVEHDRPRIDTPKPDLRYTIKGVNEKV